MRPPTWGQRRTASLQRRKNKMLSFILSNATETQLIVLIISKTLACFCLMKVYCEMLKGKPKKPKK